MKLQQVLEDLEYEVINGKVSPEEEITALVCDSRKLSPGCLFVCIPGANVDGHSFAPQAAREGAAVIVTGRPMEELPELQGAIGDLEKEGKRVPTVLRVPDERYALACLSAAWFGHPARKLTVIGITGTKGKTTTTYLVRSILEGLGCRCGLIGTIEVIIGDTHIHAGNTTPESLLLQEYFARMVEAGVDTVVMEVSSQALMLHRTAGFLFDYGVFTNLEPDHIGPNEHSSFEEYLACKAKLFRQCKVGIANRDDSHFAAIMEGHTCELTTFGIGAPASKSCDRDLYATDIRLTDTPGELGVSFTLSGLLEGEMHLPMPGKFSVYNALCAIAICAHVGSKKPGFGIPEIREALKNVHVPGRIEMVKVSDDFTLLIDYAHNAMALESLLGTLREYHPNRLVSVFGCGGNRAKSRRYEMGEVSGRMADFTIITSDNPRFEEPLDIIADIRTGMEKTQGKYIEIPDRKEAIRYAIRNGRKGDIIVLAGKGHEDYQEIKGVKYPMDERVLIREILSEEA